MYVFISSLAGDLNGVMLLYGIYKYLIYVLYFFSIRNSLWLSPFSVAGLVIILCLSGFCTIHSVVTAKFLKGLNNSKIDIFLVICKLYQLYIYF